MAALVKKKFILDEYQLELETRLLIRNGKTIHLPKRPFQVLLYLIEHRDQMVSRDELLELFWEGRDVYDVTLTKCVGRIRKALGDHLDSPRFIETRYAEGYRFIGPLEEQIVRSDPAIVEIETTRGIKIVVEEEEILEEAQASKQAQFIQTHAAPLSLSAPKSSRRIMMVALALIATTSAIVA